MKFEVLKVKQIIKLVGKISNNKSQVQKRKIITFSFFPSLVSAEEIERDGAKLVKKINLLIISLYINRFTFHYFQVFFSDNSSWFSIFRSPKV